jgi:hypothetical protein
MARFSTNPNAGGVGRSEHVSLESELSEVRAKPNLTRPLSRHELSRGGRGATASVAILPDHYAAVETWITRSKTEVSTVDLRFVDPRPVAIRKVPWRLFYVALGLTLLTGVAVAVYVMFPTLLHKIGGVVVPIGVGAVALSCYAICYYLASESLLFLSVHGRARVIAIAGRLGTMRRAQKCAAELITHINLARKQFKQTRQAYLRDEMREHARLFDQRLFSEAHYNEATRRILKAHD